MGRGCYFGDLCYYSHEKKAPIKCVPVDANGHRVEDSDAPICKFYNAEIEGSCMREMTCKFRHVNPNSDDNNEEAKEAANDVMDDLIKGVGDLNVEKKEDDKAKEEEETKKNDVDDNEEEDDKDVNKEDDENEDD